MGRRLWHRLPWLLLGVLGAMGSAIIVGAFDGQLEANVTVAFFVPAIVYMADAVGAQTETVLIRALAATGLNDRLDERPARYASEIASAPSSVTATPICWSGRSRSCR